jgi:hypothetical protein
MKRHALLTAAAAAIVTPVALAAGTPSPTERVRLQSLAASPVRATAAVGRHGRGSRVTVDVSQAPPRAHVRAVLNAGTCRSDAPASPTPDRHAPKVTDTGWRAGRNSGPARRGLTGREAPHGVVERTPREPAGERPHEPVGPVNNLGGQYT